MKDLRRALRTAALGFKTMLDAVEWSIDSGIEDPEFEQIMSSRSDEVEFDPTGEIMGEEYWKSVAGLPDGNRAVWPEPTKRVGGQIGSSKGGKKGDRYFLLPPTVVEDRHRGRPGQRVVSEVA